MADLLETADDKQAIDDTYDEWVLTVKKYVKMMRASGVMKHFTEMISEGVLAVLASVEKQTRS